MSDCFKNTLRTVLLVIVAVMICCAVSAMKFRSGNLNYKNSDATWHTMLTVQAYRETPSGIHKFLPIVSLGQSDDKYISWGATIPDKHGNYYYASFSAAGYVVPYAVMKFLGLPVKESSLYIVNTILYALSAALLGMFIYKVFHSSSISLAGICAYAFAPEILHGMGIVYWHHSVMQITLLIQVYSYFVLKTQSKKSAGILFYAMCLINPYIEWTGYIANMGYIAAEMLYSPKHNRSEALKRSAIVLSLTILAGMLFCVHYLVVISIKDLARALAGRFFARNIVAGVPFSELLEGYADSFMFLWAALVILFAVNCIVHKSFSWLRETYSAKYSWLLLVLVFPLIENVIMKQHAISYTFDRMKMIFPLAFLLCDFALAFLKRIDFRRMGLVFAAVLVVSASCANYSSYVNDNSYIWPAEYRQKNQELADYINTHYDHSNSILGMKEYPVRGYVNLLFHRGIYEYEGIGGLLEICIEQGKRYAVLLTGEQAEWSMTEFTGVKVYDAAKIYDAVKENSLEVRIEDLGGLVTVNKNL